MRLVKRALRYLLVGLVVTAWAAPGATQTSVPSGLRVEWTADPRGRWQSVCGYIYNDTPTAPREVQLRIEGRDASEQILDARIVPVLGYIAPWGRTYFCTTAPAGAARYAVTVVGVQALGDR